MRSAKPLGPFNHKYKLFIAIRIRKILSILEVENTHHLWLLSEPKIIVVNHMHIFLNGVSEHKYCTCGSVETPYHILEFNITHFPEIVDEIMECRFSVKLENNFVWL